MIGLEIDLEQVVHLLITGYSIGIILSILPYVVGCVIDSAFAIISGKGE